MNVNSAAEPSGIPGLDVLVGGGLPARGLVFLVGAPGSGSRMISAMVP
jgi:KaiC/GvpD/RAD55 family RecA-like ATPase